MKSPTAMTTRRLVRVALVLLAPLVAGCALVNLITLPFRLLFGAVAPAQGGERPVAGVIAVVEPCSAPRPTIAPVEEQSLPTLTQLDDGRFLVEAPALPRPFQVRFSAPGYEDRVISWPRDVASGVGSDGEVKVLLTLLSDR